MNDLSTGYVLYTHSCVTVSDHDNWLDEKDVKN